MIFIVGLESKLPASVEVDVVIAGGAVAGLSAAVAYARNGANIVLTEHLNAPGDLGRHGAKSYHSCPAPGKLNYHLKR
jgi:ribulose 1,5-bisphosphate synthetase/thiazole synthase